MSEEKGHSRLPLFGSFRWKGGGSGDKVGDKFTRASTASPPAGSYFIFCTKLVPFWQEWMRKRELLRILFNILKYIILKDGMDALKHLSL